MSKSKSPLRAVEPDERRPEPPTLLEAVESGDVLDMMLAQRRMIAESLSVAAGTTLGPQLNNELNKLHALIAAEQARRAVSAAEEADGGAVAADEDWSAEAI